MCDRVFETAETCSLDQSCRKIEVQYGLVTASAQNLLSLKKTMPLAGEGLFCCVPSGRTFAGWG